jgi:hypothetical protein
MVDPRGQRFGAGSSAVLLVSAFLIDQPVIVALVAVAMFASAAFGTRYWLLGRPWPSIRRALRLGPAELEHEYPPRFAQALGVVFLGFGLVLVALHVTLAGWAVIGAVVGLQTLLATTGYCLGCRLYFLRWWIPSVFARMIGRGTSVQRISLRAAQD